jgi:hypothetical protein
VKNLSQAKPVGYSKSQQGDIYSNEYESPTETLWDLFTDGTPEEYQKKSKTPEIRSLCILYTLVLGKEIYKMAYN